MFFFNKNDNDVNIAVIFVTPSFAHRVLPELQELFGHDFLFDPTSRNPRQNKIVLMLKGDVGAFLLAKYIHNLEETRNSIFGEKKYETFDGGKGEHPFGIIESLSLELINGILGSSIGYILQERREKRPPPSSS